MDIRTLGAPRVPPFPRANQTMAMSRSHHHSPACPPSFRLDPFDAAHSNFIASTRTLHRIVQHTDILEACVHVFSLVELVIIISFRTSWKIHFSFLAKRKEKNNRFYVIFYTKVHLTLVHSGRDAVSREVLLIGGVWILDICIRGVQKREGLPGSKSKRAKRPSRTLIVSFSPLFGASCVADMVWKNDFASTAGHQTETFKFC